MVHLYNVEFKSCFESECKQSIDIEFLGQKKNILDSQAPPHCPQSPRITDFIKPKKKEKFCIKKICYFVSSMFIQYLI